MAVDYTPTLGEYKELKPFRYWCQKVLPLVYDDSLSYYELLCKVVDYLNKTMEDVDTLHEDVDDLREAYIQLQDYVNNYFENLDVQEEINTKLDAMAQDGTLSAILNPLVVTNLPPIVVDSTDDMTNQHKMYILSSSGHLYQWSTTLNAFTDTGLTYGTIANVLTTKLYLTEGDLNLVEPNTVIALSYPETGDGFVHVPVKDPGYLFTYQFGTNANARMQLFYDYKNMSVWWRQSDIFSAWTRWLTTTALKDGGVIGASSANPYSTLRDLDDAPVNTMISLNSPLESGDAYVHTPGNSQAPAYVMTYQWGDSANAKMQSYFNYRDGYSFHRVCSVGGVWSNWVTDTALRDGGVVGAGSSYGYPYDTIRDLNDMPANTMVCINHPASDSVTYSHVPNNVQTSAYVLTFKWGDTNARLQLWYRYATGENYYRVCSVGGVWSEWMQNATVYNTTKTVTENTYTNTYNITCSPAITTDSHGWLASTGDTTDRSSAIVTMLTQTGYCHLGEGTFYVSSAIQMPDNSTLIGCGKKTTLRLSSSYAGSLIIPGNYCTVKDMAIKGNGSPSATIGAEVGIHIYDTKTGFDSTSTHGYRNNIIDNVQVSDFNGSGIKISGTGGSTREGSFINNCYIENCSVGLNIGAFAEYHKITACIMGNLNYIGVINSGGNNSFVNCTISGSNSGFVIDNSGSDLVNEAHGQCVGCTFNHVGGNTGDAIRIIGTNNGFLFSGCNIWYGYIRLNSSSGIHFNGCNSGSTQIIVSGCTGIMFNDLQFYDTPTITTSSNTYLRFVNCYNFRTGASIGS